MKRITSTLKQVFKNPAILYVLSRYGTYIIQFVNSLFIAVYLGPYYLGIWGFINLVLGYINQFNLGIPYSLNVIISVNKDKEEYVKTVINNSLTMMAGLCIFILLLIVLSFIFGINIGEKFEFTTFVIPVFIIAVATHFNSLLSNVFRVFGEIFAITVNQSLFTILTFLVVFFFKGKDLLWAIIFVNIVSVLISLILFLYRTPIKLKFSFDIKFIKYIQQKGWHLFIYNSSFAFILITTKSFISESYSVEEYGYFTFSFSLANAILLLLNSISYLVTPKITHRFANSDLNHIKNILKEVRSSYISLSHLLIHFVIMIFPLFLILFPQYNHVNYLFKVTALTVVLTTNLFGYNNLLAARGKEKILSHLAFSILILNILLAFGFISGLKVQFDYVMFPTMIAYFIFAFLLAFYGRKVLRLPITLIEIVKDIFPWRMALPFIFSILLIMLAAPDIYFTIPFVVYMLLNLNDLKGIKDLGIKLIKNPNFINI